MSTVAQDVTVISVRGESFVEVAPERATVHVVIDADGAEKLDVQRRAADARELCVSTVRSLHDAAEGPIVEWFASQLQTWSERPWNADGLQLPLVFHSRSTLDATFADLDAVGAWTDAASASDLVTIAGISWSVAESTRHELEQRCQRDAVANAVSKATVYAAALGLDDVRPIEISEPATSGPAEPGYGIVSRMSLASSPGPAQFTPEPIRVAVQVNARFDARGPA